MFDKIQDVFQRILGWRPTRRLLTVVFLAAAALTGAAMLALAIATVMALSGVAWVHFLIDPPHNIAGTYDCDCDDNGTSDVLVLRSDGTFTQQLTVGGKVSRSSGTWKHDVGSDDPTDYEVDSSKPLLAPFDTDPGFSAQYDIFERVRLEVSPDSGPEFVRRNWMRGVPPILLEPPG